jgi:bifunctional DNase/RNase
VTDTTGSIDVPVPGADRSEGEEVQVQDRDQEPGTETPATGAPSVASPAQRATHDVDPTEESIPVEEPVAIEFRLALVSAVTVDLPHQHPTVVLREIESPRRQLSFSIGFPEGVALSHAIRRMATPRPLTHELMTGILHSFDIDVVAVRLVGRQGSVYFAELDLRGKAGRSVRSCRPSDALTMANLQPVPAPILIDRRLLEMDGDVMPATDPPTPV